MSNVEEMSSEELSIYEQLLVDYLGTGYIADWEELSKLLKEEWDIENTVEQLMKKSKFNFSIDTEDVELITRHCGVNY